MLKSMFYNSLQINKYGSENLNAAKCYNCDMVFFEKGVILNLE